jgi:hypothetical protein
MLSAGRKPHPRGWARLLDAQLVERVDEAPRAKLGAVIRDHGFVPPASAGKLGSDPTHERRAVHGSPRWLAELGYRSPDEEQTEARATWEDAGSTTVPADWFHVAKQLDVWTSVDKDVKCVLGVGCLSGSRALREAIGVVHAPERMAPGFSWPGRGAGCA